jgi:hypothetical protein
MLLLICALSLVGATACPKREPAREALESMRHTTIEQGRVTRAAMHSLVTGYLAEVEAGLRERARTRRAELREEIHRRARDKADDVATISIAQLEAVLEGPVARLDAALRQEQSRPVHERDRARELELAVQLSTTLASLGRESGRLMQRAAERTARARDEALVLVDASMAELLAAPELDLEPDALARELLADFASASRDYDAELVAGLDQLERQLDGPSVALQGFASGVFGERLAERVVARASELLARGEAFLADELSALRVQAMERLDAIPRS